MNNFLLPYHFKWIGVALIFIGLVGLVFYIWFDFRLILPVFAIFSSFLETKMFAIIRTNIADELVMLTLLTGFFFLAFSKDKTEGELLDKLRIKAISKAIIVNTGFLVFSILFFFGNGFLTVLFLNLFSVFLFYIIFLFFLKRKELK